MLENKMRPVHPGEILRDDVLAPLGMSARAFAEHLGVPSNRVSQILAGERAVTADTALRIARLLGTTAAYWLALQALYDLKGKRLLRTVLRCGSSFTMIEETRLPS